MQHLARWLKSNNAHEQQQQHLFQSQQNLLQQNTLMNMSAQLNNMNVTHPPTQPLSFSGPVYSGLESSMMNPHQSYNPNVAFNPPPRLPRPRNMVEAHVMSALDALSDGRNLYCIMPYCSGGELFDVLEKRTKFPEREARFWFRQILEVSSLRYDS
jgi:serine/threonine protein kinase